jgi:hypothetical protein
VEAFAMTCPRALSAVLSAALAASLGGAARAAPPEVEEFADPWSALKGLIGKRQVIAFGEFHEITGKSTARSALSRFHAEILGSLVAHASDLVVETWVTTGKCGDEEKQVVAQVEQTTQRPATTEDEIVTVLKQAKAAGVTPHVLEIDCKEYQSLTDTETGKVDYVRLLTLVTAGLQKQVLRALATPLRDVAKAVVVYGGALHNDVFPRKELAAFSFAKELAKRTRDRYLEIDLYVPEYIEHDEDLTKQTWYPRYLKARKPGKVTRVRRSDSSYILVFPASSSATPSP